MKKKLLFWALFVGVLTFTMSACGDDDVDLIPDQVPAVVKESLEAMYPGAMARWELERGLYKAEFYNSDRKEVNVYFEKNGTWVKTHTDFNPMDLPQVVKDYAATNYSDRYIEDVDWVETPQINYYLLELDRENKNDIYLKITADGTVIK